MLSRLAVALLPRCHFPPPGTRIDCAVSGGPDSLALLALAVVAGCEATAYHVDHGLRQGSAAEADIVRTASEALGATFVSIRVDLAAGPNLEARACDARFAALPVRVATGHTADDQAETMLLNFMRGAGLSGLSGMRQSSRHPILGLRRSETEALVRELGLEVVRDPTNNDLAYRRNRVRAQLLPLMAEISERDLVPVLVRQAELLADEAALLEALSAALDPTSTASLAAAPLPLRRRAVRNWLSSLEGSPYPPDAAAVERVLDVAAGVTRACEVNGGLRIRRSRGRLLAERGAGERGETRAVR